MTATTLARRVPHRDTSSRVTIRKPGGMEAVLQPIVDLATGRVVGAEALARFADRRSPDLHFAEAEGNGTRVALELAAVRAALARLAELPSNTYLTVNVSPVTAISPRLPALLGAAPAHRIVLELTEHAPVADYPSLEAALSSLRERGIRIAVDDAGAGFASMRHVLALRPDVLKLDISITQGIHSDIRRRELVRAMVSFSRATGCTLVAEGIETEEDLHAIRALGVRCGQGFR
ncbi:MAG: EAL domain-containing protein, partial [Actinomycetota bacterium]